MAIPDVYRKVGAPNIFSFDFIDTIAGLGYITFYAINSDNFKKLNNAQIASPIPRIAFSTDAAAFELNSDIDWDLDFNIANIIASGALYISSTIDLINGSPNVCTARMDAFVYKVDTAGTATLLSSASGAAVEWGNNKTGSHRTLTKVDMDQTKIGAGEKLRVNTQLFTKKVSGSASTHLWTDGGSRGTSTNNQIDPSLTTADLGYKNTTDLIINVPFKLNI